MSYQKLLQTVLSYDPTDLTVFAKALQAASDLQDPLVIEVAKNLNGFEQIFNQVHLLPAADRIRLLNRIERIAKRENVAIPAYISPSATGPAPIQPYFDRRDMVWCHFGGVGTETDLRHLCLVWHDNHYMDDITVIPTTSQFTKEYTGVFKVGRITGLPPNDTILQANKMMNISRKRIDFYRGKYVQGQMASGYVDRVRHAIAILYGGEDSLDDIVRYRLGSRFHRRIALNLPSDLRAFEPRRFWAVRDLSYDYATNRLHFRKYNETVMQFIDFKPPLTGRYISPVIRNGIYDDVYGGDPTDRAAAFGNFSLHY